MEGRHLIVQVRCPVLALDRTRIDGVVVVPPLRDVRVLAGDSHVLAMAATPRTAGAVGVRGCTHAAHALLADLARRGLIRVVSAESDPVVANRRSRMKGLGVEDPRGALELAERLSRRCRRLGDFWLAAWLDLDAADIATQLGEIGRGRALAEQAWLVLGKPLANANAVVVYAGALGASGSCTEAIALLVDAEGLMVAPIDVFNVRLHRAIVLGICGRVHEAIPILEALRDDPSLTRQFRDHTQSVLGEVRRYAAGTMSWRLPRTTRSSRAWTGSSTMHRPP